jgi:hypothetical protein
MNGIDRQITQRADELIILHSRGEDLVSACSALPNSDMDNLNLAVRDHRIDMSSCLQERMARCFLSANLDQANPREFLRLCLEEQESIMPIAD